MQFIKDFIRCQYSRLWSIGCLGACILAFASFSAANAMPSEPLFNLVDNHGNEVSSNSYQGQVQVVFFGFAQCKDVCPMSLATIKQAYDALDSSLQEEVQPIFVTVDPERDTVSKVNHFVSHLGNLVGLTGSKEAIQTTLRTFRVFAMQEIGKSPTEYDVNHTSLIYLIDKSGQPCDTIASSVASQNLTELIEAIAIEKHACKGFT